jgi:hypothetical protein
MECEVKLAVYAERLDRYIENQETLNKTLVLGFNGLREEVATMQQWRSKMYGIKTALVGVSFLVVHAVGVIVTLGWVNSR